MPGTWQTAFYSLCLPQMEMMCEHMAMQLSLSAWKFDIIPQVQIVRKNVKREKFIILNF